MASLIARRSVNGIVAHSAEVQDWLSFFSELAAAKAQVILATESHTHGRTGKSHIELDKHASGKYGNVDREVALVDENGGKEGAMAIEFGRTGSRGRGGSSRGIGALHKGVMHAQIAANKKGPKSQ